MLIQGKIEPAEQTLKNILRICPFHLHSSLLLIYVCEDLHRSKKSLESYVKKIHNTLSEFDNPKERPNVQPKTTMSPKELGDRIEKAKEFLLSQ